MLISGATVIVAMAGMFISGEKTFMAFAEGTILVVAIAMFASLTVLPAMLSWLGDRIEKGRVPIIGRRGRSGESRFWSRLVDGVMRRPVVAIVLTGGLLIALAIPALGMKSVTSGIEELPQDVPVIETYNKVRAIFPSEGVTATVVVEADDVGSGATAAAIAALRAQTERSDLFLPGTTVTESRDGTVAEIAVPTRGNGTDAASVDALDELRDRIIPATIGQVQGASANVTGDAASSQDFASQLNSRLPLIFAFVFALVFVLMMLTFRSVVIPVTAIVLNLLSVGAAYGVLVLVFQNGNLESVLGFTSNGGVTNWLPLFLFVVLFGLSMDYHVFILSRIRELYDRGHEHRRRRQARHLHDRGDGHERGLRHGRRLRRVRHAELPRLQGARARPRGGGPDRRDDHPRRPAPGIDEGPRRQELVPAELAGMAAPHRRRARGAAAGRTSQDPGRAAPGPRGV